MPFFSDQEPVSDMLFNDRSLSHLIDMQREKALQCTTEYGSDALLNTSTDDIIERIIPICRVEVPMLLEDNVFQETPKEIAREVRDYGQSVKQTGFEYRITIPFTGHLGLFRHSSPISPGGPPRAKANEDGVTLVTAGYNLSADEIKKQFDKTINAIKLRLSGQATIVNQFNLSLEPLIRKTVDDRKKSILESRQIAASLGYPMMRSSHTPMTHISSNFRRKLAPVRSPQATVAPFVPEPALEEAEYQYILKILEDMSLMMERSPSAFERLEEEHLRDFFLMVLNGHYEGRATGETFNTGGKTDILIREQNQNIFIAECKYWHGEKSLVEALDQLLGYLNWRDTKACLVVFNRNKNFSAMLKTMEEAATGHVHCKRGPEIETPARLRYVFASPNDPNREITITVLAFDVPLP
jgi:hypothetical protein